MLKAELTDEQIIEIVRADDKELYGEIIRRYQSRLFNYLRKFVRNSGELEDVLQDIFIKAYRNLHGFNASLKFSSWIFRIARNEAINSIKKSKNEFLTIDGEEFKIIDEKINIGAKFDEKMAVKKIQEAIYEMKAKYRDALILFYFEEKTYEEISDILKIPTGTVGTLISRGKKILQNFFNK